jgi:hypothetical protein
MLDRVPSECGTWWRQKFDLHGYDSGWFLTFIHSRWTYGAPHEGKQALQDAVLSAFRDGFFDRLTPKAMLSPQCLVCGKGLTDPASMARWIGPECAGTSSLHIPLHTLEAVNARAPVASARAKITPAAHKFRARVQQMTQDCSRNWKWLMRHPYRPTPPSAFNLTSLGPARRAAKWKPSQTLPLPHSGQKTSSARTGRRYIGRTSWLRERPIKGRRKTRCI